MSIKEIQAKVKVLLNQSLTEEEKNILKESIAKLSEPEKPEQKTIKTKDGAQSITYSGSLEVNTKVSITNSDGSPLTEGTFMLEDGTSITVSDSTVTEKKMPEQETEMKLSEQFETRFSAQKSEFEKLVEAKFAAEKEAYEIKIKELKEMVKLSLNSIQKIMETPINIVTEKHESPELSKGEKDLIEFKQRVKQIVESHV